MPIAVDLSELPVAVRAQLHKVCTDATAAQLVQARIRQERLAKFHADNRAASIEGIGAQTVAMDPYFVGYYNMLHGRKVMHDPDFVKFLLKKEEIFRVRSRGTKIQCGYTGDGKRSSKRYERTPGK
jgi:1,6-anhydro-N-acetylmuramate kinase